MVVSASDGGRSRTADLEAQRRAQEDARRRAEEAARKAAEEARRKAEAEAKRKAEEQRRQQEAQRLADKQETENAGARKGGYQASKTQPLSAETARLQGITAQYGGEAKPAVSKTPALDAAKAAAESKAQQFDARVEGAKATFSDASPETREKVGELQKKAQTETRKVVDTATQEAEKLVVEAEKFAADKSPADRETIMAEADRRAASILENASRSTDELQAKAGDFAESALKESHEYENSNWFQKRAADVGNFFESAWEKSTELFDKTADAVGAVKDFAVEQAGNFADWAGDQAFKVVDKALDNSALGQDNEYTQEKTGVLGDLITNRLEVGESAFIKLDADANINGVALGAGAELEVKRVPASNADGTPRLEPKDEHGEPPTELQVTLVVDARAGVGLEAEFGAAGAKQTGNSVYGHDLNPGAQLNASASVEAGVQAKAEFTFHFDPNSEQDMQDLSGVLGSTAKTALPGIGLAFAGEAAQAAKNFGRHLSSVSGELGVYANAQASASASLGNIDGDSLGMGGSAGVSGKDPSMAFGNKVQDPNASEAEGPDYGLKGTIAGKALDAANLNLGEVTAGISGEVNVGAQHNFRTGETTVYLNVKGNAQASASTVGDLSAGASAEADRTIALKIKDGELQGIDVVERMSGATFHGVGKTDVMGRIQDDLLVQVGNSDTVSITRSYTPEALADFKQTSQDNPARGLGNLASSLLKPDPNPRLEVSDVKATKSAEFAIGGRIAGTGIKATFGQRLETDLDTIEAPANLNAATRDRTPANVGGR